MGTFLATWGLFPPISSPSQPSSPQSGSSKRLETINHVCPWCFLPNCAGSGHRCGAWQSSDLFFSTWGYLFFHGQDTYRKLQHQARVKLGVDLPNLPKLQKKQVHFWLEGAFCPATPVCPQKFTPGVMKPTADGPKKVHLPAGIVAIALHLHNIKH